MIKSISRRSFLHSSGIALTTIATAGSIPLVAAGNKVPLRTLGKTGLKISLLGFGGGSFFLQAKDGEWEPMLERAVKSGVNYFDTCSVYQWKSPKSSEEKFGEILPHYRKSVYVSTKFDSRDPEKARQEFDRSLKRLKMDYVDFLLIHSIGPSDDIAALEKGVYKMMLKLKEEKLTRFIGFSSMDSAERAREMLEKLEVDMTILAINATKYGNYARVALPVAREKNVGVVAMKLMRDLVVDGVKKDELLHYAWTQPGVASGVVAHTNMAEFEENLEHACSFTPEKAAALDRQGLEMRLAHLAGPHALCWARPGYRDGGFA